MSDTTATIAKLRNEYPWYRTKKAYIAGPISKLGWGPAGYKWHEASVIEGRLAGAGWQVVNPGGSVHARDNFNPAYVKHSDFMEQAKSKLLEMSVLKSSRFLEMAIIIMLDGWEGSDGALKEYAFALDHDIPAYKFVWIDRKENRWELRPCVGGEA